MLRRSLNMLYGAKGIRGVEPCVQVPLHRVTQRVVVSCSSCTLTIWHAMMFYKEKGSARS